MKILKNYEEVDKWLKEHYYFEDAWISNIDFETLTITTQRDVGGTYVAYTERLIESLQITPIRPLDLSNLPPIPLESIIFLDGIETFAVTSGVGIKFLLDSGEDFQFNAEGLTVSDEEIIKSTYAPWTDDSEIFIETTMAEIPKPSFWKEKLKEYGHEIVFRCYGGEAKDPEKVPYPGYGGYYIQLIERINESKTGICIDHIHKRNGLIVMGLENGDDFLKKVWKDLTLIVSDLPNVKIECGNCEFTGKEWKEHIQNKY